MTREICKECVLKHIAQAIILWDESLNGYPQHRHLAIGNLAEAEAECVTGYSGLAKEIRLVRKNMYEQKKLKALPALNDLLDMAEHMRDDEGCGAC